jgi:hypothetical protein
MEEEDERKTRGLGGCGEDEGLRRIGDDIKTDG